MTYIIAIDGPAASGKGTLARNLAARLDFAHLDTGKLYRAVGYTLMMNNANPEDEKEVTRLAVMMADHFDPALLSNAALTQDDVGSMASQISAYSGVRQALLHLQKNFAATPPADRKGAVLDGRDIGTVICPDAGIKFFIKADTEIRAKRRYEELKQNYSSPCYEAVLEDMQARDARDSNRTEAPLKAAEDAHILDTSAFSPQEVLEKALEHVANTWPELLDK